MKKGFTLIELLAVLIVLAVIGLIAIPIVADIVAEAEKKAASEHFNAIIRASNNYWEGEKLNNNRPSLVDLTTNTIKYDGGKPEKGFVQYDKKGNMTVYMYYKGYCMYRNYEGTISIEEKDSNECNFLYNITEITLTGQGQTINVDPFKLVTLNDISGMMTEIYYNYGNSGLSLQEMLEEIKYMYYEVFNYNINNTIITFNQNEAPLAMFLLYYDIPSEIKNATLEYTLNNHNNNLISLAITNDIELDIKALIENLNDGPYNSYTIDFLNNTLGNLNIAFPNSSSKISHTYNDISHRKYFGVLTLRNSETSSYNNFSIQNVKLIYGGLNQFKELDFITQNAFNNYEDPGIVDKYGKVFNSFSESEFTTNIGTGTYDKFGKYYYRYNIQTESGPKTFERILFGNGYNEILTIEEEYMILLDNSEIVVTGNDLNGFEEEMPLNQRIYRCMPFWLNYYRNNELMFSRYIPMVNSSHCYAR